MNDDVKVLLAFFPLDPRAEELESEELTPYVRGLPVDLVEPIARYLEIATYVWPSMGAVDDVIHGAFMASDSISTDGTYVWQTWAGQYVRHYAIALPQEFIEHCRAHDFRPPQVSPDDEYEIDEFLRKKLYSRVRRKRKLWVDGPPHPDLLVV